MSRITRFLSTRPSLLWPNPYCSNLRAPDFALKTGKNRTYRPDKSLKLNYTYIYTRFSNTRQEKKPNYRMLCTFPKIAQNSKPGPTISAISIPLLTSSSGNFSRMVMQRPLSKQRDYHLPQAPNPFISAHSCETCPRKTIPSRLRRLKLRIPAQAGTHIYQSSLILNHFPRVTGRERRAPRMPHPPFSPKILSLCGKVPFKNRRKCPLARKNARKR